MIPRKQNALVVLGMTLLFAWVAAKGWRWLPFVLIALAAGAVWILASNNP